jgi:hypothetical protein
MNFSTAVTLDLPFCCLSSNHNSQMASGRDSSRCSAATFPGRTTPLLTSHVTFLRVSFPYPSMPTSIQSALRPSAVILYPLSRIHISTARILCILCPILVHVCSGSSVSFSPFFPYRFPLLYLCLLRYPLFICPGFYLAASDYFGLPFFLL